MREVTDEKEIRELLPKFEFMMYNRSNKHEGELTTLDKKDIDDIIGDMELNPLLAPKVYTDGHSVVIKYPDNVCKLVSIT